jgi:flavin-dependent dehydrogenase
MIYIILKMKRALELIVEQRKTAHLNFSKTCLCLNGLILVGRAAGDFCGLDFGGTALACFAGDFAGDFLADPPFGVGGFGLCFGFFGVLS